MAGVQLSHVTKKYGDFEALHALDLEIREGEFLTLLGPSGCGKTTTLRLIAGFIQPTSGTIYIGEDDITAVAPQHRKIGMVFQDYALFPHMTVRENIAFGLDERRYEKHRIAERVDELLDLIRLPDMGERYPSEGCLRADCRLLTASPMSGGTRKAGPGIPATAAPAPGSTSLPAQAVPQRSGSSSRDVITGTSVSMSGQFRRTERCCSQIGLIPTSREPHTSNR